MKTSKPLSTVSYNTHDFLISKLNDLVENKIIYFWSLIKHKAEKEETKEHYHIIIFPCDRVDTIAFQPLFKEFDPTRPTDPLGCLPFDISKDFGNWYLYALHDIDFLLSKGKTKKYHYTQDQLECSDIDYLNHLIDQINFNTYTPIKQMKELIASGWTFDTMVKTGFIKWNQLQAMKEIYNLLYQDYRYNLEHQETKEEDLYNLKTGEIIE